jgi:hypothetical protein
VEVVSMKWFRLCFVTSGIFFLGIALIPNLQITTKPGADEATETRRTFMLGVPGSPLVLVEEFDKEPMRMVRPDGGVTVDGGSTHRSVELGYVSWSMLSLVFGALLLEADRRWHSNRKS